MRYTSYWEVKSPNTMCSTVFSYVIPGPYPEWLYQWALPNRPASPPAPTFASTFPLPSANHLWESLGGDTIPGGPAEPARLRQSLTLHERWRVLLTPPADWGGEDGGLVPEHGERGRGERTARGEWVWEGPHRNMLNNYWISKTTYLRFPP